MLPLKTEVAPGQVKNSKSLIRPLLDTIAITAIQYQRQVTVSSWPTGALFDNDIPPRVSAAPQSNLNGT